MSEARAEDVVPLYIDAFVAVVGRVPDHGAGERVVGVRLGCVVADGVPDQDLPAGQDGLEHGYDCGADDGTPAPRDARIRADGAGRGASFGGARPAPRLVEDAVGVGRGLALDLIDGGPGEVLGRVVM